LNKMDETDNQQPCLEPLEETWRWFGPGDPVTLEDARQAGATGIVTSLHQIPIGELWTREAIHERIAEIGASGGPGRKILHWSVVESLAVHDEIKRGDASKGKLIGIWIDSLRNLASAGVRRIAYHFMPVFDWTRTDLGWTVPDSGGLALRFDYIALVAFDMFILQRPGAADDYSREHLDAASNYWAALSNADRHDLCATMIRGLPGGHDPFSIDAFRYALDSFRDINRDALRENLKYFLARVVPIAEELGVLLAIHPDDPPLPLLGIPRIISTMEDFAWLADSERSIHNGLTFCVGSLSSSAKNDVLAMLNRFVSRVHFLHGRSIKIEADGLSFYESEHLKGDVNLPAVLQIVMREQARRKRDGVESWQIPVRPDHGHVLLRDSMRDCNPGYSAVGRLKGLAEIRGAMKAIEHLDHQWAQNEAILAMIS
jgi:mannonate dehydratase